EKGGTVYETATPVGVGFTGGWSTFQQTGKVQVDLEAGVQTVRLAFSGGSMDLKSFTLDKVDQAPIPSPQTVSGGGSVAPAQNFVPRNDAPVVEPSPVNEPDPIRTVPSTEQFFQFDVFRVPENARSVITFDEEANSRSVTYFGKDGSQTKLTTYLDGDDAGMSLVAYHADGTKTVYDHTNGVLILGGTTGPNVDDFNF
ncbi:carbohydrate-binding protein, partial [Microvirga lenta]|uniref:hypothetical protein n=1 Tax=Microvirga lenta TaxID=2881337 RepID=UPI001CFFC19A